MPSPTTSPLYVPLLFLLELDAWLDDWAIPDEPPASDERTER